MSKVSTQWTHSLELFQVNVLVKFEGECDIVFVSKVGVGVRKGWMCEGVEGAEVTNATALS